MPDFTSPGAFTNLEIGQRSLIEGQVLRTDEDANTVSARLDIGLRSGQSSPEVVRADVTATLEHAQEGGTDWSYTWSNATLNATTVGTTYASSAQRVTGDVNDYRRCVISLKERA